MLIFNNKFIFNKNFSCECRNSLLNGFRCQGNTRSFKGDGFAWFKPMPACTSLNISLRFMTKEDGLILYNGPIDNIDKDILKYSDYLLIYIKDGFLNVRLQFNGKNESILTINQIVTDDRFHTLTLTQNHKQLELVLDECATQSEVDDSCRNSISAVDDDERLNIVTPLQLGGIAKLDEHSLQYPLFIRSLRGFNGCIRKLIINNDVSFF